MMVAEKAFVPGVADSRLMFRIWKSSFSKFSIFWLRAEEKIEINKNKPKAKVKDGFIVILVSISILGFCHMHFGDASMVNLLPVGPLQIDGVKVGSICR